MNYIYQLAQHNPFAFHFIVGTLIIGCLALVHPASRGGNRW